MLMALSYWQSPLDADAPDLDPDEGAHLDAHHLLPHPLLLFCTSLPAQVCVCVWKPLETSWAATPLGPWCADSSLLSLAPLSTGALTMPVVPMTGKVFLPFMTTGGKTLTHPSSPPHVRAPIYIYGCLFSAQGTFGAAPKHKAMYNDVILSGTRKFVVVDHLLTKVCALLFAPPTPHASPIPHL